MVSMSDDFDHLTGGIAEVKKAMQYKVVAGVPYDDDHLNMVALVQEMGKHISAKHYPYLVIPTANAEGRKTSQIDGLYKRGHALGVDDKSQPNGFKIMFVLRKSVDIPSRPFLRFTLNHKGADWSNLVGDMVFKMLMGKLDHMTALKQLGERMRDDVKDTLDKFDTPPNAPLTEKRKGFNNPLIDKGTLKRRITYMIVKQ